MGIFFAKKIFYSSLFLLFPLFGWAQPDSIPSQNYFAIKGKILPWLLGNMGGLNLTLGAEQSFFTHHSIAIEGYFYGIQDHHDNMIADSSWSDDHYSRDRALALTYRFYFDEDLSASDKFSFYLGLTGRWGKQVQTWDPAFREEPALKEVRDYLAAGPIAGLVIKIKKKVNLDLYAGTVYNSKTLTSTYDLGLVESGKLSSWDLRLGINLSWWFTW